MTIGRRRGRVPLFDSARTSIRLSVGVGIGRALLGAAAAVALGAVVDRLGRGDSVALLVWLIAALLVARSVLAFLAPRAAATTSHRVESDLRRRVLDAVLRVGPWAGRRTGEVVGKATDGIDAVGALAGTFLPQLVGGMAIPLLLIGVVAFVDWATALVLLLALPLVPMLLRMLEKRFASVSARYRATADQLAARFLDGIQGLRTLKALDRAGAYGDDLAAESERLRFETMALLRVNQLALLAVDSLFTLGTIVAAAGMAGWRLSSGAIETGAAVTLVLLGVMLIEPLTAIGRFFYVGAIGRAAAAQVRDLLGLAAPTAVVVDGAATETEVGGVELDAVTYSYEDGTKALDRVSMRVAPGERLALVGPSGSGKTTLANLILGLLTPDAGAVRVGGRAALVSQRPFLFHGSVVENLLLAKPTATTEEIWRVLDTAELAGVVNDRHEGLDVPVGERGLRMSGGEAQRLAIARALLVDASVVVLDEPTSNVDLETESRIRAALDRLTEGRTVIIIAHRRSTVAGVDRVIRLTGGRISEPLSDSEAVPAGGP